MKALSLTQPWATLVASGAKGWETRSWRTDYRGILAIHAAKRFPVDARALCVLEPFRFRLLGATLCREEELETPTFLPLGAVLAVTWLEDVLPVEHADVGEEERAFGDYSPGRYAWKLRDPIYFAPIAASGALGLWNFPDELVPERARNAIRHPGPA